jgi:cytidylate kinase
LRDEDIGRAASQVAVHQGVRAALLAFQRDFARRPPGAVLDGRDIGTVVCPDATAKLFITATPEARAERRFKELAERGEPLGLNNVLQDIRTRDARDVGRDAAPLRQAKDALLLDTSGIGIEEAFAAALELVHRRLEAAP